MPSLTDTRPARCRIRLFYFTLAVLLLWYISVESFFTPLQQNRTFNQWPAVPCVIQVSKLRSWGMTRDGLYVPEIKFSYSVEGETYSGNQFAWAATLKPKSRDRVKAILSAYPAGSTAVCFVEPGNPGRAYLKRPRASGWFPFWTGALAFMAFWIALYWLVEEVRRKPLPA